MKYKTRLFGEVTVNEDKVITFSQGLPAFENMKRYIILENEDKEIPLDWLQSLDNPDLAFVIINPYVFKKDYDFKLMPETMEELDIKDAGEIVVFSLVVIPKDIKKMTANLLAPLVVNARTRRGKQVILQDKRYKTKHIILEGIGGVKGGEEDACSNKKEK